LGTFRAYGMHKKYIEVFYPDAPALRKKLGRAFRSFAKHISERVQVGRYGRLYSFAGETHNALYPTFESFSEAFGELSESIANECDAGKKLSRSPLVLAADMAGIKCILFVEKPEPGVTKADSIHDLYKMTFARLVNGVWHFSPASSEQIGACGIVILIEADHYYRMLRSDPVADTDCFREGIETA
jgi:hypothetical protein